MSMALLVVAAGAVFVVMVVTVAVVIVVVVIKAVIVAVAVVVVVLAVVGVVVSVLAGGNHRVWPEKTADIWRPYQWFPRQMTSEKLAQKFHTDDVSLPRSG